MEVLEGNVQTPPQEYRSRYTLSEGGRIRLARQPPPNLSTVLSPRLTLPHSTEKPAFFPRAQNWPTILTPISKTWQLQSHTGTRLSKARSNSLHCPPRANTKNSRNSSRSLNPTFPQLEDGTTAAAASAAPALAATPSPPHKNKPSTAASRNSKRPSRTNGYKAGSAPPTAMTLATNTTASHVETKPRATLTQKPAKTPPA